VSPLTVQSPATRKAIDRVVRFRWTNVSPALLSLIRIFYLPWSPNCSWCWLPAISLVVNIKAGQRGVSTMISLSTQLTYLLVPKPRRFGWLLAQVASFRPCLRKGRWPVGWSSSTTDGVCGKIRTNIRSREGSDRRSFSRLASSISVELHYTHGRRRCQMRAVGLRPAGRAPSYRSYKRSAAYSVVPCDA